MIKLTDLINEGRFREKKLSDLRMGEKFFFNDKNKIYQFIELYGDKNGNSARVKLPNGEESVISFGGGVVNKERRKSGYQKYLDQGGRDWD